MVVHNYTNTASTAVLDAPLNSSGSTFNVSSFTGYPSVPFFILMDRDTSSAELMEVTNVAGNTLTANRGSGGTASTSHSAGATVEHVIPAAVPQAAEQHHEATTGVHGVTGGLVGASNTGTLLNKTFRGAHTHNYTDVEPTSPAAGFIVNADSSISRDGFVANNGAANNDRRGFLLSQSGSERFEVFYDGTARVTPAGSAVRPAVDVVGLTRTQDLSVLDDVDVVGDLAVGGSATLGSVSTGNATVSGTLSSPGENSFGTVTASGLVTASGSGTGLSVANTASVGTLNVTSGHATVSAANKGFVWPVFGSNYSGTVVNETRIRARQLEIWRPTDSTWYRPSHIDPYTIYQFASAQTVNTSNDVLAQATIPDPGYPYKLGFQAQAEFNNVTSGTRYDLTIVLDSSSNETFITTGLGNGFTQTMLGFTGRLTGAHTFYVCARRSVGSGSMQLTAFNQMLTVFELGTNGIG